MSEHRKAYLNIQLDDNRLPFIVEISRSYKIYYRYRGKGQLLRANSTIVNKGRWIKAYIDKFNITIKGRDEITEQIIYDIEEIKEEVKNVQ